MKNLLHFIIVLLGLSGCTADKQATVALLQCIDCHTTQTDSNHQQTCVSCHRGNNQATDRKAAHLNYVASPAHPDHLADSCEPCHTEIVKRIYSSEHFTLARSTNLFRRAFGAEDKLTVFLDTPKTSDPTSALELADDLLRRRCFRCHPYSSGDNYPSVSHGTGCASCHMAFKDGKLESHNWRRPGDEQCLSCHYGNYVGFDYYGRFEHDFNAEYRTPYTTKSRHFRPYGVEYHQLKPDIHQLRGMLCIDCHDGRELMEAGGEKPSCKKCHQQDELQRELPSQVERQKGLFILHGRDGKDHPIPLMQHPAHTRDNAKISCQACHAQWTFNDWERHFLRSDTDDFDPWSNLSVQGDVEIETIIENNTDYDKTELPAQMTDKLTGELEIGLWHKGFAMRRWESPLLGRDSDGTITTMRPVLDYSLSWIDEDELVRFNSVKAKTSNNGLRPYVPHTTGPAGLLYKERIAQFLVQEKIAAAKTASTDANNDR